MNASRLWASRGQGPYPKSSLFSPCTPSLRGLIHPMASTTACVPRTLSAWTFSCEPRPGLQPSTVVGCGMHCWLDLLAETQLVPSPLGQPWLPQGLCPPNQRSRGHSYGRYLKEKCLCFDVKWKGEPIKLFRHRELVYVKYIGWKMEKGSRMYQWLLSLVRNGWFFFFFVWHCCAF